MISAANSDEEEDYFETYRKLGLIFDPALKGHDNLAKAYHSIGRAVAQRKMLEDSLRLLHYTFSRIATRRSTNSRTAGSPDQLGNRVMTSGSKELPDERRTKNR